MALCWDMVTLIAWQEISFALLKLYPNTMSTLTVPEVLEESSVLITAGTGRQRQKNKCL